MLVCGTIRLYALCTVAAARTIAIIAWGWLSGLGFLSASLAIADLWLCLPSH